jgi:hypothetical protein
MIETTSECKKAIKKINSFCDVCKKEYLCYQYNAYNYG